MTSPDRPNVDRVIVSVLVHTWRGMLMHGHLNPAGLIGLRARLDPTTGEFPPSTDLDLLRLDLDAALANVLDVDPNELPGRPNLDHVPDEWA